MRELRTCGRGRTSAPGFEKSLFTFTLMEDEQSHRTKQLIRSAGQAGAMLRVQWPKKTLAASPAEVAPLINPSLTFYSRPGKCDEALCDS